MSGARRSLVVTRKSDGAQVRVLREFANGYVLWDEHMGAGKLCMDLLDLTGAKLFWRMHEHYRIFPCGHKQPSHRYKCVTCMSVIPPCANGRKNHKWSRPKDGTRRCHECKTRAFLDPDTGRILRCEPC